MIKDSLVMKTRKKGAVNESKQIISKALKLMPYERLLLVDTMMKSLSKPDHEIDELWREEAEKRLDAVLSGRMDTVNWQKI